ncbi:unnamed protein product [Phytomonas sp. Hart1]|nr:unnamed protein product [Phytomonas sp. Hart1]|eukprot:CCW69921.1 unnamed protein product [Phytomonas sp. isolate Hart1]
MASLTSIFFRPVTFIILILFLLTIFDCSVLVPTIHATMPKISKILSHEGKTFNCEICGAVLEGIDVARHMYSKPMDRHANVCNSSSSCSQIRTSNDLHQSFYFNERGNIRVLPPEMHRYCQNILEGTLNIFEMNNNKNDLIASFILEHKHFLCHYISIHTDPKNYGYSRGLLGESTQNTSSPLPNEKDKNICFQFPELSQVSRSSLSIPLYTYTWFLRYPLNELHQQYCYQFCEATLNLKERMQLVLWRHFVIYNVHQFLYACRYVYPWLIRTIAILVFLFSQALHKEIPMGVYPQKSKDWDTSQSGPKDGAARADRNGISIKGSNVFDHSNGNPGGGTNLSYPLDTYYSTRSGQTSKRKKR